MTMPAGGYDFTAMFSERQQASERDLLAVNGMTPVQAFRWYNANGLLALPAKPGEKALAMNGGYHFDTFRPLTEADVASLEQIWKPGWRVALVMGLGSRLVGLDVDDLEQWERFRAEHDIPPTLVQASGREGGGIGVVFRRPDDEDVFPAGLRPGDGVTGTHVLVLKQGAWSEEYPGITVKSKGILIVAPSVHRTGRQYQWTAQGTGEPAQITAELLAARAGGMLMSGRAERLASLQEQREDWLTADRNARRKLAAETGAAPPQMASMTLREFLVSDEAEPVPFVVPGTLPEGCTMLLTGEEGRGKSTLVRWQAECYAAGIHPWKAERYEGGTALLIDAENPRPLLRERLRELSAFLEYYFPGAAERISDRLIVESQPAGFDLSSEAWADYLERIIDERRPQLVLGGPLYKLSGEQPKSEEFFLAISSVLDRLKSRYGFSLMIEAHCRQENGNGRPEWPYGNSGWRRWPDIGYYLSNSGRLTDWRGNRYGDAAKWPVQLMKVPGSNVAWSAIFGQQASGAMATDLASKVAQVRAAVDAQPGINQKDLRRLAGGTGNQWIDAAVSAGAIKAQPLGPGKATLYWPADDFGKLYDIASRQGR
jgi:hypothetical protein